MIRKVGAAFLAAAIIAPLSAAAQDVPGGVEQGAREGERATGLWGLSLAARSGGRQRCNRNIESRSATSFPQLFS